MFRQFTKALNVQVNGGFQSQQWRVLDMGMIPCLLRGMNTTAVNIQVKEMKTNGSKSAFLEHEFTEKTYEVRKDTPNTLSFQVRKMSTANKVHLNLEDLPTELHGPFVQHIIADFVKLHKAGVQKFQLNNVTEDAFRNVLNMPIRKLGYTSKFTRCNKDRGLAYFERLAVMDQCPNCDKGGDKNLLK